MGPNGYLGFTVHTDCYGQDIDMCVHGGRTVDSETLGCIRTSDHFMDFIMWHHQQDPVECIIIEKEYAN